jgi:hypothetical protein
MLKISLVDSARQRRLVVEGKLVAPWAAELIDPRNRTDFGSTTGTVKAQSARARQKLEELMRRTLRPQYRRLPSRLLEFASSTS